MKYRRLIALMALVFTLVLAPAVLSYAMPPEPASGTWTYVLTHLEVTKEAGDNIFRYGEEIGTWHGTFEGTSEDYFELVVHPKGFVTCQGRIDFEGSVNGRSGTMVILFVGKKNLETGLWSGKWVILNGAGDLVNLRGHGTWDGPSFSLEYAGQIHFDPAP